MNLFDKLIKEVLKTRSSISPLKVVVEKELLHHDILRILSNAGLLKDLTFIGGTCLRACYGGIRLSEDLDFTGGANFKREDLSGLGKELMLQLKNKYGLSVNVTEPLKDKKNVDTWKVKVETRPENRALPAQRINIDICSIPSYQRQPMLLRNHYGIDMGTMGLVIQAQSIEEIFTDKLLAFALRPNRIKYRDLWDILWLHQQGYNPSMELIPLKLKDRHLSGESFVELFSSRNETLSREKKIKEEFLKEMSRFLPIDVWDSIAENKDFVSSVSILMQSFLVQIKKMLET